MLLPTPQTFMLNFKFMLVTVYTIEEGGKIGVGLGLVLSKFLSVNLQFNLGRWNFWRVPVSKTNTENCLKIASWKYFLKIQNYNITTKPLQIIIHTVTEKNDDQFYIRFVPLKVKGTDWWEHVFIILLHGRNKGQLC